MKPQIIFGFHAVGARLRTRPESVREIYVDAKREDKRMTGLLETAKAKEVRVMTVDGKRLDGMSGNARHQGVVAMAEASQLPQFVDDVLDLLTEPPLLLVLDGVTDPHNPRRLPAVADAAGRTQ
jgi:23S rRNA (guanosine2251-2'-O)-methyltransferase